MWSGESLTWERVQGRGGPLEAPGGSAARGGRPLPPRSVCLAAGWLTMVLGSLILSTAPKAPWF